MSEEEKRERYYYIVERLYIINNKSSKLYNNLSDMENVIKNNLLINKKVPKEERITNCYSKVDSSIDNIKYNIIPSLEHKIYY